LLLSKKSQQKNSSRERTSLLPVVPPYLRPASRPDASYAVKT
jgi:hypothetical protein